MQGTLLVMEEFAKSITLDNKRARYYDLSSLNKPNMNKAKRVAHFYGGNGFTVGNYLPLIGELAKGFEMHALAMRGYWFDKPKERVLTREKDADMLIEFLEKTQDKAIVAIGHSQGATATAMAAAKRPELFAELYLIEPVTFTKAQSTLYNLLPRAFLQTQEPFKSTLAKQKTWPSIEAYYEHLRSKNAYRRISDEHLQLFVEQSLVANSNSNGDGSYELLFAPKYELASYFGTPYIDPALKQLQHSKVPYTLITGKPTIFINDKVRKQWQTFVPNDRLITLPDYGHLLPIEAPKICADIILQHMKQ
ncbi:alpha/beta hydrolase [Psychrobacter sp. AH5]